MIHANSIQSYDDIKPELSGRRKEIYLTIWKRSKKMTDREVKDELGLSDMNSVRPRITELIKSGHLEEVGNVKCPLTGKTVRQVMVLNEAQMSLF
jgi:predicted HTH transcriptional regulator